MFDELGLNFDDLDDLQSLVDQVLSEKQAEEGFIIFLRYWLFVADLLPELMPELLFADVCVFMKLDGAACLL